LILRTGRTAGEELMTERRPVREIAAREVLVDDRDPIPARVIDLLVVFRTS
jgi:hypothetical protein